MNRIQNFYIGWNDPDMRRFQIKLNGFSPEYPKIFSYVNLYYIMIAVVIIRK